MWASVVGMVFSYTVYVVCYTNVSFDIGVVSMHFIQWIAVRNL